MAVAGEKWLPDASKSEIDDEPLLAQSSVFTEASTGIAGSDFFKSTSRHDVAGWSLEVVIKGTSHVGVLNLASTWQRFLEVTETNLEESGKQGAVSEVESHLNMLWRSYVVQASSSFSFPFPC
mmetsp:Transcript_110458/g.195221  ORF Transcript_110458/g.195221 Transcript_110458/m.195221 type:complete len:123 (-) Transcript_110458:338-706(-)